VAAIALPDDQRLSLERPATREDRALPAHHAWPVLLVFAMALATRLYQLGEESLWIDEAISFGRARLAWPELLEDSIRRKHLPTYFVLLKAWMQLGDSEWMLRFPSALWGAVAAVLVYATGVVLHGRLAGLLAGGLMALASGQVHYGQEARMYALFTLASSTALLGLSWLAKHPAEAASMPRPRDWSIEGRRPAGLAWLSVFAGTTLAMYTHNTAVFFLAALNLAAIAVWLAGSGWRKGFARNWLACMAAVLGVWAIWLPTLLHQSGDMQETWRGRAPTFDWVRGVVLDLYGFGDHSVATFLLVVVLVGVAAHVLRDRKRLFWSTLAFAVGGALCALVVSQVVPMFYRRLLIWESPAWFVLIGVGIAGMPRLLAGFVAVALATIVLPSLSGYYARETKPAWRPMIQALSDDSAADARVFSARGERFLTYYYERKTDPLPARAFERTKENLERQLDGVDEFYLVGQTQEAKYKQAQAWIRRSKRYKTVWTKRSQNAVIVKYRLRRGTSSPNKSAVQPPG
jgi:mannosyltransferase